MKCFTIRKIIRQRDTLENKIPQALADNRFMDPTLDTGTFPCKHWIGLLSITLQDNIE
jgi:hypothetical protein